MPLPWLRNDVQPRKYTQLAAAVQLGRLDQPYAFQRLARIYRQEGISQRIEGRQDAMQSSLVGQLAGQYCLRWPIGKMLYGNMQPSKAHTPTGVYDTLHPDLVLLGGLYGKIMHCV
jgi:hypothetical protein